MKGIGIVMIDATLKNIDWESLQGKKFFITGSTGLIGSWFVKLLLWLDSKYSLNLKLILLVRSEEKAKFIFGESRNIEYIVQDVIYPLSSSINADYYLLAACSASPAAYKAKPVDVMNANYLGVQNILKNIVDNNTVSPKVLYVSSSEVYGEYECGPEGVEETFEGKVNHYAIRACYTESKRATETLCLSYGEQYGIDISIARPGFIFGPAWMQNNNRADIEFFNCVKAKTPIVLKSKGAQLRSYCFVKDVATALFMILLNGKKGEAYNVALDPDESITIAEFAYKIASAGGIECTFASDVSETGWSPFSKAVLNNQKLKELGWLPSYSVEEGIRSTIELQGKDPSKIPFIN